jgi:DNA-binding MarR family transcriptional regulator
MLLVTLRSASHVSDRKQRSGGVVAPHPEVKSNLKHGSRENSKDNLRDLPAKANSLGGQPVSIAGLTSLSGYLLRRAQLWVFHDFNQRLAPLDLRPAQYSILAVTRENPGLSQIALSQVLGIGRSGIVPLLDVLEARALLTRAPAADRRSHALFLTAKGSALLAKADVLVQQNQDRLIDKVGRCQHDQLLQILEVFGRPD